MFYRDQLEQINDPDFQVRAYTEEEEKAWLSHDADFATTDPGNMPDAAGRVPLGRLQMGFVLGAAAFRENARTVDLSWEKAKFRMLIADPFDLWKEKEVAVHRINRSQDSLHLEVLSTTLQLETIHSAEKVADDHLPFELWAARVSEILSRWNRMLEIGKLAPRLLALNVPDINTYLSQH